MAFVTILLSVTFSHHADELATNTLISIKLVSRIDRDVDRQRRLINEHIAESESDALRAIAPRIAELDEDIAAAKRGYEPLTTLPGENEAWRVLEAEIAALKGPIEEIRPLSSGNQDAGARAALVVLNERYDDIDRGIEKLIRINQDRADEVLARIEVLQHSSLLMFVAMGSAGLIVTLLVGLRVHRRIRRSEEDASL